MRPYKLRSHLNAHIDVGLPVVQETQFTCFIVCMYCYYFNGHALNGFHLEGSSPRDLFPNAPLGEIAWIGSFWGLIAFFFCGQAPTKLPKGKKKRKPGFTVNFLVNGEN